MFYLKTNTWILSTIIVIVIMMSGCSAQTNLPLVNLYMEEEVTGMKEQDESDTIILAIASVISPKESLNKYEGFISYLEEKLGQPIQVIQKQTYGEVNQLIKEGKADISLTCSLAYRVGSLEGYLEGLASPVVEGANVYRSYIITNINNPYDSLDDLQGKRFAFVDPISYSGRLSVLDLLNEKGYRAAEDFFGNVFFTYSHDYSLLAAADNVVDGAAMDSLLYDQLLRQNNPDVKNLKVIDEGEWAGTPPIVMKKDLDPLLKRKLREVLYSMDEDTEGKLILKSLGIDEYTEVNETNYKVIDELIVKLGEQL